MLIAFKGFDKDLTCTNHGNTYQYRLGVWNEEDKANCGINGMHCAENPWTAYPTIRTGTGQCITWLSLMVILTRMHMTAKLAAPG